MYFEDVKISIQAGIRQGIREELEKLGYKRNTESSNFFRGVYTHVSAPDIKLDLDQGIFEKFVNEILEPTYREYPYLR